MDSPSHFSRRKACDFCVSRKSRCDMLEPACSNCKVFGVQCRITNMPKTIRRRVPPASNQTSPSILRRSPPSEDAIGSRLAHIEEQLEQLIADRTNTEKSGQTASLPSTSRSIDKPGFGDLPAAQVYRASDMWNQEPTPPCLGLSIPFPTGTTTTSMGPLELPPLSQLLPVVDNYFNNYNRFIPLFDRTSFERMILDWHSSTAKQTLVAWAAVNIVQAISYRLLDDLPLDDPRLSECIHNVRSVTTELMAWNKNLLGLQVLLGMVIIFQGTTDPQLATVLIAAAIRLAQGMGLPSRRDLDGLSSAELSQRTLVFWIAYILDRDLALRSKAAYTQFDAETDLELPGLDDKDHLGILTSSIGGISINYMRKRVELAHIQGKVHDILYSRRSHYLTQDQRLNNISRVEKMLVEWRNKLPAELLRSGGLLECFSGTPAFLMMDMYNRHLECLFRIHSIFSFDDSWMRRTHCYFLPTVIELGEDEVDGELVNLGLSPLPEAWADCVENCRLCLELATSDKFTEYFRLLHACCTASCLIALLVNTIEFPDHGSVIHDWNLIDRTQSMLREMNDKASRDELAFLKIADDLARRARGQVKRRTLESMMIPQEDIENELFWTHYE
ncbi:fungal-specific transcription factor domain-containing protein [Xylaria arbuscula]|nr:fungal-specific transcription factor domain-containing protein [Xylaria arbuscula]